MTWIAVIARQGCRGSRHMGLAFPHLRATCGVRFPQWAACPRLVGPPTPDRWWWLVGRHWTSIRATRASRAPQSAAEQHRPHSCETAVAFHVGSACCGMVSKPLRWSATWPLRHYARSTRLRYFQLHGCRATVKLAQCELIVVNSAAISRDSCAQSPANWTF